MRNNPKKNVEEFARSSKVNDDIANQIQKSSTSTGKSYDDVYISMIDLWFDNIFYERGLILWAKQMIKGQESAQ